MSVWKTVVTLASCLVLLGCRSSGTIQDLSSGAVWEYDLGAPDGLRLVSGTQEVGPGWRLPPVKLLGIGEFLRADNGTAAPQLPVGVDPEYSGYRGKMELLLWRHSARDSPSERYGVVVNIDQQKAMRASEFLYFALFFFPSAVLPIPFEQTETYGITLYVYRSRALVSARRFRVRIKLKARGAIGVSQWDTIKRGLICRFATRKLFTVLADVPQQKPGSPQEGVAPQGGHITQEYWFPQVVR